MSNTVDDLINSVKVRSLAPISENTFSNARLLPLMTEEMRSYIAPKILAVREDFFLNYHDQAFEADRSLYPLYERCTGGSFKELSFLDDGGNEWPLKRTEVKDIQHFQGKGQPSHYFIMGDQIRVLKTPATAVGSLRQYYFRSLSALTTTSNCAKITAISVGVDNTTFTVDTDLTGSLSLLSKIDFQNAQSPFLLWKHDVEIVSINSTEIVVSNASVQDEGSVRIGVDDYICPRYQTNIPQIPVEYHTLLSQKVVCKLYEALGDTRKYQPALVELKTMEKDLFTLIKSRASAQPRKVIGGGTMRSYNG